jgi:hypothetical protein
VGHLFGPLEKAIWEEFLLALLGTQTTLGKKVTAIMALGTKMAGMGLPDPTEQAHPNAKASRKATDYLVESLLEGTPWTSRHISKPPTRPNRRPARNGQPGKRPGSMPSWPTNS